MSSGKILLGLLAGAAVGATIGILFAPDKGSSTRKKISEKSDEYVDELEDKFNGFIDIVTKKFKTMKEEASHVADDIKLKAEETEA